MDQTTAVKEKVFKRHNINVLSKGERTLLFAHGFGCDQNVWRSVTPAFEDEFEIVLFDYVGAGRSDLSSYNPLKYNSLSGYADDVLEIRRVIASKDVIFVGHSVSSMIGLLAGIKDPGAFTGIIMIGPSPRYINDGDYTGGFNKEDLDNLLNMMDNNYLGWSGTVAPMIMGNPDRPELGEELTGNFCSTDPDIAKQFARVTFYSDNRKDVPRLSIPTLILQCSDDIIAPKEVGKYLDQHLPNSRFVEMEATGHCPHMSHPEETIEAMKAFLALEVHA